MRISTHYNRIDRVIYHFDQSDIKAALMDKAKVKYEPGKRIEVDIDTDADYKTTATLTVVWESGPTTSEQGDYIDE